MRSAMGNLLNIGREVQVLQKEEAVVAIKLLRTQYKTLGGIKYQGYLELEGQDQATPREDVSALPKKFWNPLQYFTRQG